MFKHQSSSQKQSREFEYRLPNDNVGASVKWLALLIVNWHKMIGFLGLCAEILVLCEMGLSNMKMSCNSFAPSVKVVSVKGDDYSHLADGEADIQKADGVPQVLES